MKLYVVRHGETIDNVLNLVQGQNDSELTLKGIKDAYKLQSKINKLKIDIIFSSPLKRAKDTAKIITNNKLPINIDDRLIERDWGLCERASLDIVDRVKCWNCNLDYKENSIEPLSQFIKRISEFIEDIKVKYKDKNILIVTHSAVSRVIYYYLNGFPKDGDLSKKNISNLEIKEYKIK